jgi:hypothetical protein
VVDRGPDFDRVRIGRPDMGELIDAVFSRHDDRPDDLDELSGSHGVGCNLAVALNVSRIAPWPNGAVSRQQKIDPRCRAPGRRRV